MDLRYFLNDLYLDLVMNLNNNNLYLNGFSYLAMTPPPPTNFFLGLSNGKSSGIDDLTEVLIFCFEFRELSHLTRNLYQAEKKITVVTN